MRWSWIEELVSCIPGREAQATMIFRDNIFFFRDHSPDDPKVPGAIQIEMIAQTAGMCIRATREGTSTVLIRVMNAKFFRPIRPDDPCRIGIRVSRLGIEAATIAGDIFVKGDCCCKAELRIAIVPGGAGYPAMDAILERWRVQQRSETP
jgi:3-hydroxyacyl-[acyl-carrier-protein] dehydratase